MVPRAAPPRLIEAEYAKELVSFVREWRVALVSLLGERTDSISRSKPHLRKARTVLTSTIQRTHHVADRTARAVVRHSKAQVARQTKAALGVTVPTVDRGVPARIEGFIHENVARIQRLGNKTLDDVETILAKAYADGLGEADVAAELHERFAIAERHARFLARDQVTKLYAKVTRMQHQEVGVRVFRWKTQRDGHVRKAHAVKHDRIFPYTGSRAPSFLPGDETGCRCWEEPVFEEIREMAGIGKGRKRVA